MSYSNDAQGSRSRRKIQRQNSYDKMSKNISDVSQAGGAGIAVLGATGIGLALKAKNTTTKPVSKKGLTSPNQKNVGKVLNRLNRMSIPYDSHTLKSYGVKTNTKLDSVISNKKLDVNKSQNLYESSNKGKQNLRLTRLSKYNAERTIGTNKGHKSYSGKLDFNKSNLVKDVKNYRTMGKIFKTLKSLSPVGLVAKIMEPKKVGDGTLKGNERQFKKDYGNT